MNAATNTILGHLADPTGTWVAAYFNPDGPFAGDMFDTYGTNPPDEWHNDDLLAVSFLDVNIPAKGVRALHGPTGTALNNLLADPALPANLDLWEATEGTLNQAERAWNALRQIPGVDTVTAGKFLARKRPRLIPVVDSVILNLVPGPNNETWRTLRFALQDPALRERLHELRPTGLNPNVSTLRLLDVALWMRGSQNRNALQVRGESRS